MLSGQGWRKCDSSGRSGGVRVSQVKNPFLDLAHFASRPQVEGPYAAVPGQGTISNSLTCTL